MKKKGNTKSEKLENKILSKFHYLTIAIPNSRVSGFFVSSKAAGDTAYYDMQSKQIVFTRALVDNIASHEAEETLTDNMARSVIIHEALHSAQTLFWPKIRCPVSSMLINHLEDWRLNRMASKQFPYFKRSAEVLNGILAKSRNSEKTEEDKGAVGEFVETIAGLWVNALDPSTFQYDLDIAIRKMRNPEAKKAAEQSKEYLVGAYNAIPNNLSDPFSASAASRVALENYWNFLKTVDELTQRKLIEDILNKAKQMGLSPEDLADRIQKQNKQERGKSEAGKDQQREGQQGQGQQGQGQQGQGQQGQGQQGQGQQGQGQQGQGQQGQGQQGQGQQGQGQQGQGQQGQGQQGQGQQGQGQQGQGQQGQDQQGQGQQGQGQQGQGQPGQGQQGQGQPGQGQQGQGQQGQGKPGSGEKGDTTKSKNEEESLDSMIDRLRDDTKKELIDRLNNPQTGSGEGEGQGVPGSPDVVDEDGNIQKNGENEGKGKKPSKGAGLIDGHPRIAEDEETARVDPEAALNYINEHASLHRELAREMANAMGGEMREGPKIRLPSEARGRINTSALVERITDSEASQPLYVSRKPGHKVQGRRIFQADMVISVVDGSGSMSGGPMQVAKGIVSGIMAACSMNKIPFLSAVNYNNVTHVLADGKLDMPSRVDYQRKIMAMSTYGGTDMAGGSILTMTQRAAEQTKIRDSDAGRIIFITDGYIYGPDTIKTALGCISAMSMPTIVLIAREGGYKSTTGDRQVRYINQAVREAAEAGGSCGCTMYFDTSDREAMGMSFSAFCQWMRDPKVMAKREHDIIDPSVVGRPLNLPIQNFEQTFETEVHRL